MGKYNYDMSQEKEPTGQTVFTEGWHEFIVTAMKDEVSKAGNEMFVITLTEKDEGGTLDLYAVAVKGKRWILKLFLDACGVKQDSEGIFDWDIEDCLGKVVRGRIQNHDENWIDRENKPRTTEKSKITHFESGDTIDLGNLEEVQ